MDLHTCDFLATAIADAALFGGIVGSVVGISVSAVFSALTGVLGDYLDRKKGQSSGRDLA